VASILWVAQVDRVLVISGLQFSYRERSSGLDVPVFRDFDLSVEAGEFVSVVGPSGCGKSTLLYLIAGLLQSTGGTIAIDGSTVTGPSRRTSLVFQQPSLLLWRTALANVAWPLELQRMSKGAAKVRAEEMLKLVGLEEQKHRYPRQLSGGMQQRVNLARALAPNPNVLLADEPFASLDAQTREIMQQHLLDIWARQPKTVLFVTHQIEEALFLADRVVVLLRGGVLREDLNVPFARPRPIALRRSAEFVQLAQRIWNLIEADVLQSAELAGWGPVSTASQKQAS
jgi:NitT/TauT family transport system ATP-binding protein